MKSIDLSYLRLEKRRDNLVTEKRNLVIASKKDDAKLLELVPIVKQCISENGRLTTDLAKSYPKLRRSFRFKRQRIAAIEKELPGLSAFLECIFRVVMDPITLRSYMDVLFAAFRLMKSLPYEAVYKEAFRCLVEEVPEKDDLSNALMTAVNGTMIDLKRIIDLQDELNNPEKAYKINIARFNKEFPHQNIGTKVTNRWPNRLPPKFSDALTCHKRKRKAQGQPMKRIRVASVQGVADSPVSSYGTLWQSNKDAAASALISLSADSTKSEFVAVPSLLQLSSLST